MFLKSTQKTHRSKYHMKIDKIEAIFVRDEISLKQQLFSMISMEQMSYIKTCLTAPWDQKVTGNIRPTTVWRYKNLTNSSNSF
jgi:hypothetical protein